jgi:hypothetical protein
MNKKIDSEAISEVREEKGTLGEFDKSAVPNMYFQHAPTIPSPAGAAISMFETDFLESPPNFGFRKMFDFVAEENHIVGQWKFGGMQTDDTFYGLSLGPPLSASIGKTRFIGSALGNVEDGKTVEKIDLEDVLIVFRQLRFFSGI